MSTATLPLSPVQAPQTPVVEAPIPRIARIVGAIEVNATEADKPRKRLFSAGEYLWMAELGLFEGQRVELIDGEIIAMPPMTEMHAQSLTETSERLVEPLLGRYKVRGQLPFHAGENQRPEPDIAVVRPEALNPDTPPSEALLIVEISRSTLEYDRTTKLSLYASIGISDYWIVNLAENQVEVYRQPIERAEAQFGHDYANRQIYLRGQSVALLQVPDVSIEVDAMLP